MICIRCNQSTMLGIECSCTTYIVWIEGERQKIYKSPYSKRSLVERYMEDRPFSPEDEEDFTVYAKDYTGKIFSHSVQAKVSIEYDVTQNRIDEDVAAG